MTQPAAEPERSPRLPALSVAAALLVGEALASIALAVVEALHVNPIRPVVGVGATILLLGYAVALIFLARGLRAARRWSRGPIVASQLIQLPIAWSFRGPGTTWVAMLLGLVSIIVLVCVLVPSSTAALINSVDRPDSPTPPAADR